MPTTQSATSVAGSQGQIANALFSLDALDPVGTPAYFGERKNGR